MKKLLILGLIFGAFGMGVQATHAEGIEEDKDTIEDRGPGNLDVPEEKSPEKPKEEAKEKAPETSSPQPSEDKVPSEKTSDTE